MSNRVLAVCTAFVVADVAVPPGAAAHSRHHRQHSHQHHAKPVDPPPPAPKPASFDGSCDLSGAVHFTPPMTTTPQTIAQHADAPGTCTGTFVDSHGTSHQLTNAPTRDVSDSSGDNVACEFGLAAGTGELIFPDGSIPFTLHEYRPGATPLIRFDGKVSGGGWLVATPSPSGNPVTALQACAGSGLTEFDLSAHFQTDSPMTG